MIQIIQLQQDANISSIDSEAFIKVLSRIRRSDGVSPDPGITKIKIREGGTHFANSVILTVEYNSSVDIGPVNIRLYKNSLNQDKTFINASFYTKYVVVLFVSLIPPIPTESMISVL